jgi:hypothetical protein
MAYSLDTSFGFLPRSKDPLLIKNFFLSLICFGISNPPPSFMNLLLWIFSSISLEICS